MIERTDNFIASLGVEAYRVGGSVRDELLGRKPKDADYMVRGVTLRDLTTLLRDRGVKRVSPLTDRRGQTFGVRAGDIEIALPRREQNAGSGRAQVIVADPSITLEEDARRRDFTFNALYMPISLEGFAAPPVDPTGRGMFDLSRGLIQTTHPDSFLDDPLRTLRALRFVARGFSLGTDTRAQMEQWSGEVTGLSANGYASGTVLDEMSKILMGDSVGDALRIARDTGVLASLFPELAPMLGFDQGSRYHDLTTDEHTFKALNTAAVAEASLRVRWALLFHDAGKPESAWVGDDGRKHYYAANGTEDHEVVGERIWRAVAERIGVPRELREDVARLILHHMVSLEGHFKASKVRRGRIKFGDALLRDLYIHRACDISGKGMPDVLHLGRLKAMEDARREARTQGVPCSVRDLKVTGHDAMAAGLSGAAIGEALQSILVDVASQPSARVLTREWQLARLEVSNRG